MANGGGDYKNYSIFKKILLVWTPSGSDHFMKWLSSWGIEPIIFAAVVFAGLFISALSYDPAAAEGTFAALVAFSPLWLPLALAAAFWITWIHYIRYAYWFAQDFILLELQLPPDVEKSPLAMEVFLSSLWNAAGEATFIHRFWRGSFRPAWSLEIAGNEGQVKFYLHTKKNMKNIVEARLYGQYPEAKIMEVEDYVSKVPFSTDTYSLWGAEFQKSEPQALPIRSYLDYGLDKNTDTPEVQIDPITNITELLGSIGKDEHFWMQIIIRARKKDEWYGIFSSADSYKDSAKKGIEDIIKKATERLQGIMDPEEKKRASASMMNLTETERNHIEAIERSLSKNLFECGVRVLYVAKHDRFDPANIGGVVRFFDAYRYPGYNSLGLTRGLAMFDFPWQDFMEIRQNKVRRNLFSHYKHRAYFFVPYDQVPVFMTTEELATIWHFPSSAVRTPGLDRVPSRRSEAPSNLPTSSS